MKTTSIALLVLKAALATALLFVSTTILFGQEKMEKLEKLDKVANLGEKMKKGFCETDNWSNGDKVSTRDLREMTVPALGSLAVDASKNGGIRVKGSDRSDVLVRACVQAWGTTAEAAQSLIGSVRISTTGTIKAEAAEESQWSVSYEIFVPRSTNLNLKAQNGGISIGGVEGRMEFETQNGGLHLGDIAGDVRGRTMNGGVHVSLSGNTWRGTGLDLVTTNGGIHLNMPDTYAANIETGTVNGGFHSNIAALSVNKDDQKDRYHRATKLNTALNGGGAPIRLITTNGGVHIKSSSKTAY